MFVAGKAPVEHIFFHTNYFYDSLRKPIFCLCGAPMSQVSYLSLLVSLFFFLLSFPLPPSPPHRLAARISPSLYCQVSGLFASFPPIFTCLGKHRCQTFVLIMRHFFGSICLRCDCNTKMNISWKWHIRWPFVSFSAEKTRVACQGKNRAWGENPGTHRLRSVSLGAVAWIRAFLVKQVCCKLLCCVLFHPHLKIYRHIVGLAEKHMPHQHALFCPHQHHADCAPCSRAQSRKFLFTPGLPASSSVPALSFCLWRHIHQQRRSRFPPPHIMDLISSKDHLNAS